MKSVSILILLSCALTACTGKPEAETTASKEFNEKRTHCFGHSLIDLPKDFYQSDGSTATFSTSSDGKASPPVDLTILSQKSSERHFLHKIVERRAEILENAKPDLGALTTEREIASNAHMFTINVIEQSHTSEMHILLAGHYLVLTTDTYDNQFATGEARLVDLLKRMSVNIDAGAGDDGYCLGNLTISGKFSEERSKLRFLNQRFPGVDFGIESDTFAPNEQKSLLERVDGPASLLHKFDVKNHVLRKGELQVASMKAQEWLSWVLLGDGSDQKKQYGFALETTRPMPSPAHPRIHLEMDSGQADASGDEHDNLMSDAEAVALWDGASRSIRSRKPATGQQVRIPQ